MLRKDLASRLGRVGLFGLVALAAGAVFTTGVEARRHFRYQHVAAPDDSSPKFSSIIVDGNSGAVLTATSPDGLRHPASLTKIMTLYLLFESVAAGKIRLDTAMPVSERAASQAPTKLDLRPGQTIRVEDAIKGLVTRSANDAAVVIAEALGGSEDNFAKMMTRKAHALGMSHTIYRNASGLPDDDQVTTARDQATLGRAIQDSFPRYYHYFSTLAFNYHGQSIRNHNHLLGNMEGIDGIKTGYTSASGFNLVTSMHRGNRFLVGVVMGGRSAGSRDAIMRGLLAENLERAATTRTVAAIAEHAIARADDDGAPPPASAGAAAEAKIPASASRLSVLAGATAAVPPEQPRTDPAPLAAGTIQSAPPALGSTEPMKPVKVKTVQVKTVQVKAATASRIASASPSQGGTDAVPARPDVPEISAAAAVKPDPAKPEPAKPDPARTDAARTNLAPQPAAKAGFARAEARPQPPGSGTGDRAPGVLQASSNASSPLSEAMAYARPPSQQPPQSIHSGWIVQVGALESEDEALQRIEDARNQAHGLLSNADPFTEPVIAKDEHKLYRARFAGLEREQAEAVCLTLSRSDMTCITVPASR